MKDYKISALTSKIQSLMNTRSDFPQKLKQCLVLATNKVTNPFKFIACLLINDVLCDGSNDPEATFGLKEMMAQLAMTIACAKGADAVGGLMEALEESENSHVISNVRTLVDEDFTLELNNGGLKKPQDTVSAGVPSEMPEKPVKNRHEFSSNDTELVGKVIMFQKEKDLIVHDIASAESDMEFIPGSSEHVEPPSVMDAPEDELDDYLLDLRSKLSYICERCGRNVYYSRRNRHIETSCKHTCEICGRRMSLQAMRKHQNVCRDEYKCDLKHYRQGSCPGVFRIRAEYVSHIHSCSVVCEVCGGHFRGRDRNAHNQKCKPSD